jgi:hypothetical protein
VAIYHLTANIGSKDDGKSAGQKCAYITRTDAYKNKADECAYTASGNMPKWPKVNPQEDASHYWKAADTYERDNGRLFRELEFSLPRELTLDQQKELCHAFADKVTTLAKGEKLPFTFAIHVDKDSHNPHCHLMISERVNDGINRNASTWFKRANAKDPKKGGAIKTQELNGRQWLNPTREAWAAMANGALKKAGIASTIDHRSHEERKLDALPTKHMGAVYSRMLSKGIPCENGLEIKQHNEVVKALNAVIPNHGLSRNRMTKFTFGCLRHFHRFSCPSPSPYDRPKSIKQIMEEIARGVGRSLKDLLQAYAALQAQTAANLQQAQPTPTWRPKPPRPRF